MSAADFATVPIEVYRSPAISGGIVTDQEMYLDDLFMVAPMPVSSEPFLAYTIQSNRRTWESAIYADRDNALPDIQDGDKIKDTENNQWYTVRGSNRWTRPWGGSHISLLLDEYKVTA